MISIKESGTFKEIDIMLGDQKIGSAEVNTKTHELTRLQIYEPYRGKGYGKFAVSELITKYNIRHLEVRADNERAKALYEKFGFKVGDPTFYKMEVRNEH